MRKNCGHHVSTIVPTGHSVVQIKLCALSAHVRINCGHHVLTGARTCAVEMRTCAQTVGIICPASHPQTIL